MAEGLGEPLHRGEGLGPFGRAGGDVDDAAHRIARIARRIRAVDDIELADLGRADDPPGGREAEAVAEEIGDDKAVDHHQRAGALRAVGAAKAGDRVVVADEAGAHEEVGGIFDEILDIGGVDRGELIGAEADRQAAGFDADRRLALADDEDGGVVGFGAGGGARQQQQGRERAARDNGHANP